MSAHRVVEAEDMLVEIERSADDTANPFIHGMTEVGRQSPGLQPAVKRPERNSAISR
jgi:hypothetical protein